MSSFARTRFFSLPGSAYWRLEAVTMLAIDDEDGERYEPLTDLEEQVPEDATHRTFVDLIGVMPGGESDYLAERPTMEGILQIVQRLGGMEI